MKNIIFLLLACLFLCSCKDFLEPKSETEYIPDDAEGLNEMLLGVAYPAYNESGYWGFLGMIDDDVTARPWVAAITGTGVNYYQEERSIRYSKVMYSWAENYSLRISDEGLPGTVDIYSTVYNHIVGANAALDYIDDVKAKSLSARLNVKAQAYAMRGFHYFHLTNVYGTPYNSHPNGLGVPLKLTSKVEQELPYRKTVKECYDRIVSDFLMAEQCYTEMGDDHQWKNDHRTSLAMVRLMLSRVYLYMENWPEAARYAKLVMDDPTFSLWNLNNYAIPTQSRPNAANPEVNYVNFTSYAFPETIWLYGNVSDVFNTTIIIPTGVKYAEDYPYLIVASNELLNAYNERTAAGSDLRHAHYMVTEIAANQNPDLSIKRAYGKTLVKIFNLGRPLDQTGTGTSTTFGRSLRLSEAYLNYAEAVAMMVKEGDAGGDVSFVLSAINELRANRIAASDYVALGAGDFASPDELVNFVRNERRRELCFEGHRWFDLRRWGMPEITHTWEETSGNVETFTLPAGGSFYAIPLPHKILEANSALDPDTWKN